METSARSVSTLFFRAVILLVGIGILGFMLYEPHLEGRNVNATLFEIYFNDPFLAYAYLGSIPFFVALYQAFKLSGSAGREAAHALKKIKYCALALIALIAGAEVFFILPMRGEDDIAGGVAMGLFAMIISIIIAATAAKFQKKLQSA